MAQRTISILVILISFVCCDCAMAGESDPGFPQRDRLTGNWGGYRDRLVEKGVKLDIEFSEYYQGMFSGDGNAKFSYWAGPFTLTFMVYDPLDRTDDHFRFVHWLLEARKRFSLQILNYTVIVNHVHLLVKDNEGITTIPSAIQLVSGHTAQEYNQRKHRKGTGVFATGDACVLRESTEAYKANLDPEIRAIAPNIGLLGDVFT